MFEYLPFLLLINYSATLYMVGVIWMVQLVHYPLMSKVGDELFVEYHHNHTKIMVVVVGPAMCVEAVSMVMMLAFLEGFHYWLAVFGLVLVLVIWASTALLQIPCHTRLEKGFRMNTHRFLVRSNWLRTIAWSVRGCLMGWLCYESVFP